MPGIIQSKTANDGASGWLSASKACIPSVVLMTS